MKKDGKLNLILGSHAHVPSGAGESEFEYVYENKMRPFVSNLYRYSKIQAVLHYSGVLLYWVERTHPEFFMLIEDMVSRKQAEILSGGFYEPMLPLIPVQDRIGQIELLTTYLRKHFGKRPLGCWIPAMAWEQNLVAALAASDMSYTFLSHDQFLRAGLQGEALLYPCISEDQGKLITVFPVSMETSAALAEKSFTQVFIEFKNALREKKLPLGGSVVSVFPDKAACGPEEAHDSVWNRFFEELSLSEDFVETVLPSKILKDHKPCAKASFPNSSYYENDYSPRRFLIERCESNGIYAKMIFTNVLIGQLKGDKSRKQNAREELWRAQDSCLFTPEASRHELRKAAYSSLLRAERLCGDRGRSFSSLIQYDFDLDGVQEFLFQDMRMNCYIQLLGAGIFELDYLPADWNYLDCGSQGPVRRTAFADVLLPFGTKVQDMEKGIPAGARLCYKEQFESSSQDRKGMSDFRLPAVEDNVPFAGIELEKRYSLKKEILTVTYMIKNTGKEKTAFSFVPEIDFSFAGEGEEFTRCFTVENSGKETQAAGVSQNVQNLKILDVKNEVQILLGSVKEFALCLSTVRGGDLYQASRILPLFDVSLESAESWTNEFSLKFSH